MKSIVQLDPLKDQFFTSPEKDELIAKLQEVEDWLYEDGEDETNGVYVAKLEELQKQGNPIEERYKEWTERGPAIDQLVYCINSFRAAALSNDPKFDHIDIAEIQKVEIEDIEWNEELQAFTYPCPCGDLFQITKEDISNGYLISRLFF